MPPESPATGTVALVGAPLPGSFEGRARAARDRALPCGRSQRPPPPPSRLGSLRPPNHPPAQLGGYSYAAAQWGRMSDADLTRMVMREFRMNSITLKRDALEAIVSVVRR